MIALPPDAGLVQAWAGIYGHTTHENPHPQGTKEIGGTCIEIEAQGKRVVLDVGLPLDAPDDADAEVHESLIPRVPGFRELDDSLLGVVISHSHPDHYGLARNIRPEIPVHIGEAAHNILKVARPFVPQGYAFTDPHFLHHHTPVEIGPFRITPHLVDHSAFDAYALLVEADGKRVFYSGDFRAHGRKASVIEAVIQHPPQDIDALLMEGTTIGRTGTGEGFVTEAELEQEFVQAFEETGGLHFVWTSAQNIDRVVTIFRAARRTGRVLLIDLYAALVLEATGRPTIPQSHWDGVKLYVPHRQRVLIKNNRMFEDLRRHERNRIYPEELPGLRGKAAMLFRTGMMYDRGLRAVLDGTRLTYSMWEGYLKEESTRKVTKWLEENGIPWQVLHTSGHASVADLQRFAAALAPRRLVPIHSYETARFAEFFENVDRQEDGVWWEV